MTVYSLFSSGELRMERDDDIFSAPTDQTLETIFASTEAGQEYLRSLPVDDLVSFLHLLAGRWSARYQNDVYHRPNDSPPDIPGNPWFISTLWLGEYFIVRAESLQELHEALPYLEWCGKNALPSGVFAEQVHPVNSSPLSVSPLTWSHSAFVWAVLQYTEKFDSFQKS